MSTLLVTGGCGFIGSHFVALALQKGYRVINVDALTYAAMRAFDPSNQYVFVQGKIQDEKGMDEVFQRYRPLHVLNFAAESHVDRSIHSPRPFIETNIEGTFVLLEAARKWRI